MSKKKKPTTNVNAEVSTPKKVEKETITLVGILPSGEKWEREFPHGAAVELTNNPSSGWKLKRGEKLPTGK